MLQQYFHSDLCVGNKAVVSKAQRVLEKETDDKKSCGDVQKNVSAGEKNTDNDDQNNVDDKKNDESSVTVQKMEEVTDISSSKKRGIKRKLVTQVNQNLFCYVIINSSWQLKHFPHCCVVMLSVVVCGN